MRTIAIETAQVDVGVARSIIEEAAANLAPDKVSVLHGLLDSHLELMRLLREKGTTIARLRRLFNLRKSERLETVLGKTEASTATEAGGDAAKDVGSADLLVANEPASGSSSCDKAGTAKSDTADSRPGKPRRTRTSGRRAAAEYEGPETLVKHKDLCRGDSCLLCNRGKVYAFRPVISLVIRGQAPLVADKVRLEAWRCNACGAVFNAELPAESRGPKYRPSSVAILAAIHYTFGMPFYRQDHLQSLVGIPVPASTQWKLMNEAEPRVRPVFEALKKHAAKSRLFHIDDTYLKILEALLAKAEGPGAPAKGVGPNRTGQFTTGVLTKDRDGHRVALFVTGRQHAGENLVDLMKLRPPGLHPPIVMSDALSRNTSGLGGVLMAYYAYCLAHARRGVVDQLENFPREAQHVLEELAKVFRFDKRARQLGLSGRRRRVYHRKHSGPVLKDLKSSIRACFDERRVEPNSDMGKALRYILRHWKKLTLFLRQPDAPLTNNACERLLKIAIRYRKNSLFYKNARGAHVGDTFMTLIYTAELDGKNPVHYLTALLEHHEAVAADPKAWLPWTYEASLVKLPTASSPSVQPQLALASNA